MVHTLEFSIDLYDTSFYKWSNGKNIKPQTTTQGMGKRLRS